jgi:hypothetical protein
MRIDPKNLKGAEDRKGKKITDPKDPAVLALADVSPSATIEQRKVPDFP